MAADELARLRAEVDRLLTEQAEFAARVREKVAAERARLKAKVAQIQTRTRPLLQQARREIERLSYERRTWEKAQGSLERRVSDAETGARKLATENKRLKAELSTAKAETKKQARSVRKAKSAAKQAEAKAAETAAAADATPAAGPPRAGPPRVKRPPRPAFMRSTQIISTGSANAVWQDYAKKVTETKRSTETPGRVVGTRRAIHPEDLESREEPLGFEGVGGIESAVGLDSLSDLDQIDDDSISDIDLMGLLDESD